MASRDLDLNLALGELVAVLSEADTRGDRRRWLVDAGGKKLRPWETMSQSHLWSKSAKVFRNNFFKS